MEKSCGAVRTAVQWLALSRVGLSGWKHEEEERGGGRGGGGCTEEARSGGSEKRQQQRTLTNEAMKQWMNRSC